MPTPYHHAVVLMEVPLVLLPSDVSAWDSSALKEAISADVDDTCEDAVDTAAALASASLTCSAFCTACSSACSCFCNWAICFCNSDTVVLVLLLLSLLLLPPPPPPPAPAELPADLVVVVEVLDVVVPSALVVVESAVLAVDAAVDLVVGVLIVSPELMLLILDMPKIPIREDGSTVIDFGRRSFRNIV